MRRQRSILAAAKLDYELHYIFRGPQQLLYRFAMTTAASLPDLSGACAQCLRQFPYKPLEEQSLYSELGFYVDGLPLRRRTVLLSRRLRRTHVGIVPPMLHAIR